MADIDIEISGLTVRVLDGPYLDDDGAPTDEARKFGQEIVGRVPEFRGLAADQLLSMYNEDWRGDEEEPSISRETFIARLVNPHIHVYDEIGAACVYFDDSNMFGGHYIEVWINENEVSDIGIVG